MKKQLFIFFAFLMTHFACLNGYEVSGNSERHDMNNIYEMKHYEVSKNQKEHYTYILKYDFNNLSKYLIIIMGLWYLISLLERS